VSVAAIAVQMMVKTRTKVPSASAALTLAMFVSNE
jgi:hypothetical protein